MSASSALGGWDVHTHIIPPAVIAAGAGGLYGMRTDARTLHICAHGIPLHPNSELAAKTVSQLSTKWVGAIAGTELGTLCNVSERFDSLWQALSDSKSPLFIHSGGSPDRRLDAFYLGNLWGNALETSIAAADLIFAGLMHMHRFPGLKVILANGGGCIAALSGHWQPKGQSFRHSPWRPRDVVRKFYVDGVVHPPPFLRAIIDIIGDDRILLGSDWPFSMATPTADHDLGSLDLALRRKIRKTNAEAVFGCIHKFPNGSTHTPRT
jgi:aminocarboxymuconate-semialdehyde decarboxylase